MRALLARKPVAKLRHDYVATNVTTSAWVELIDALEEAASAVEIFDGSGSIIKLSLGDAGEEDDNELPYYIMPGGGGGVMIPMELAKGKRLSAKAVDATAATGSLIINFFG